MKTRVGGTKDYTTSFTVDQSPEEVFSAVTNVRGWWSGEIEGHTDRLGAEFTYRYQDVHRSTQKITELVPGQKVVWHIVDSYISFAKDTTEWNGTDVVFEIAKAGRQDPTSLYARRFGSFYRMLRELFKRLELLHQRQFARPDYGCERAAQPERRVKTSPGHARGGRQLGLRQSLTSTSNTPGGRRREPNARLLSTARTGVTAHQRAM